MSWRVHLRPNWALEILRELLHVWERSCKVNLIISPRLEWWYQDPIFHIHKKTLIQYSRLACNESTTTTPWPTVDPEDVRGVNPREEPQSEGLLPVLGAPHVGRAHPECLGLGVGQAGQARLGSVARLPGLCNVKTRWEEKPRRLPVTHCRLCRQPSARHCPRCFPPGIKLIKNCILQSSVKLWKTINY